MISLRILQTLKGFELQKDNGVYNNRLFGYIAKWETIAVYKSLKAAQRAKRESHIANGGLIVG